MADTQNEDRAPDVHIDLASIYVEVCTRLEEADRHAAELRGQKKMLERLIQMTQQPILSAVAGDAAPPAPPAPPAPRYVGDVPESAARNGKKV